MDDYVEDAKHKLIVTFLMFFSFYFFKSDMGSC